jgi:hypothetical protein
VFPSCSDMTGASLNPLWEEKKNPSRTQEVPGQSCTTPCYPGSRQSGDATMTRCSFVGLSPSGSSSVPKHLPIWPSRTAFSFPVSCGAQIGGGRRRHRAAGMRDRRKMPRPTRLGVRVREPEAALIRLSSRRRVGWAETGRKVA